MLNFMFMWFYTHCNFNGDEKMMIFKKQKKKKKKKKNNNNNRKRSSFVPIVKILCFCWPSLSFYLY